MTNNITIIGAGMAGLLAGNMLRRSKVQIVERQSDLPNNHHAVLRFRTKRVSEQTHIPFREVRVFKACDEADPIRAAMLYSDKVTGRYEVRSLINLEPSTRYIAPPDFISRMAEGLDIAYGVNGLLYLVPDRREEVGPVISTLPMPTLMDALEYEGDRPAFSSNCGFTISCDISDCDVHLTRYYAATRDQIYRASITGSHLVIEFAGILRSGEDTSEPALRRMCHSIMRDFGIENCAINNAQLHEARYAKLGSLNPEDRRKAMDFMFWASTKLNIFSLGRFATWRSGLLMDDVVDDILKIERWIGGSRYDIQKGI